MKARKKRAIKEIVFQIEESLDGGFEAQALGFSIYTEAETVAGLKKAVRDAVECHFSEKDRPGIIRLHFVRDELIAI